ncbi:hypothetical protein [Amycolatopsis saalfeldensis]|uniref:Uncharacterized protein n=1 Tax=Amycolatopsis saalfeldensis TaxID=394193 RepID=A0A1H8YII7_9PSEU|nr:hypothetical protein [Amycolatopsis saalfeldensis]SEP51872.1 hypothetical protein SAMN04489732_117190 [Amycolatopsis saalfeldensis]
MMGEIRRPRLDVLVLGLLALAGLVGALLMVVEAFLAALSRPFENWTGELSGQWPWLLPVLVGLAGAFLLRRRGFAAAFAVLLVIDLAGLFGPGLLEPDPEPPWNPVPVSSAVR